ncbi:vesicle-associated membrane protein 2-like isoform X2 [Homarus americanus]|uniref:vesicle-associated membrane protein 2-like isoform X2 n=1 Tax=Homarus americanus TaxID=6706 RepID=UPI001C43905C|nr:vesicle-associated membrane protein 2-like isoform X2 [Homarus americanus]
MHSQFTPKMGSGSHKKNGTMMNPDPQMSQDPAKVAAQSRLSATQQQVNEVVDIMKTNVERIIEREEGLTELDVRANNLTASASEFQTTSRKLKRKYWWKNLKMMLILGCVIILVIIIIIVATVGIPSSSGGGGNNPTSAPDSTLSVSAAPPNREARAIMDTLTA